MSKYKPTVLVALCLFTACKSDPQPKYTNRLIHEQSPYLLQHAHNPVDWYPWNDQALQTAREQDKPLLISIGYAACHWCHVMEKESFMDTSVARMMNEHFINIKVDREERPDVDDVYMSACQLASPSGCGWPLQVIALPDGRPVWVGTYSPKKTWLDILAYFAKIWDEERPQMNVFADKLTEALAEVPGPAPAAAEIPEDLGETLARNMLQHMDPQYGGRAGAPKFPMPPMLEWLLDYSSRTNHQPSRLELFRTLENMIRGGIHDQIGGGFARYATDLQWRIPHFEKMLYDNAQLLSLFSQAYMAAGDPSYKKAAEGIRTWMRRELRSEQGPYFSSLDADSEGEEGKYYVWEAREVDQLLHQNSALVKARFGMTEAGNWENGKNILWREMTSQALSDSFGLAREEVLHKMDEAKAILLEKRSQRIPPRLDDKAITCWNGLVITGLAHAYRAFGEEKDRTEALALGHFYRQQLQTKDGGLKRIYKSGKASIPAFLDDYGALAEAYLDLYEISFDESWLNQARLTVDYVLEHFQDSSSLLLFYTSALNHNLVARRKQLEDNVIPSSNALIARAMHRLGHLQYDEELIDRAREMLSEALHHIGQDVRPDFFGYWGKLYLEIARPYYQVAIVGPDWDQKRRGMQRHYLPQAQFLGGAQEGKLSLLQHKLRDAQTTVYVCRERLCKLPVTEVEQALGQLEEGN